MDVDDIFRHGKTIAPEHHRSGQKIGDREIMWALTCEAFYVARFYSSPPKTGYPSKSAMPDAPEEVTYWQKVMAALRGEGDMPDAADGFRPPIPAAADFTRADIVLRWFHEYALSEAGRRKTLRKAVAAKAIGVRDCVVRVNTGLNKHQIIRAKQRAMDDMLRGIAPSAPSVVRFTA